jgi:hypothetical protein
MALPFAPAALRRNCCSHTTRHETASERFGFDAVDSRRTENAMTIKELEFRVQQLERVVERLQSRLVHQVGVNPKGRWWRDAAGRFADDPIFDEIVRLGRQYRESLRPERRKSPKQLGKKK